MANDLEFCLQAIDAMPDDTDYVHCLREIEPAVRRLGGEELFDEVSNHLASTDPAGAKKALVKATQPPTWWDKNGDRIPFAYLILMLFALGVWLYARSDVSLAQQASGWPQTSAQVTSSEVRTHISGGTRRINSASGGTSTRYPAIEYEYVVDGQSYQSDTVVVGSVQESAEEIVDRFPVGATVDAYYDPSDPSRAVLLRGPPVGASLFSMLALAATVLFLALALWQLIRAFLGRPNPPG